MQEDKICGGCLLYVQTYLGGECRLTDNPVEYTQPACMDPVADEDAEGTEIDYGKRSK